MREARISRRSLVGAGAVGMVGVLLAPHAVFAEDDEDALEHVRRLRWDITGTITTTNLQDQLFETHVVPGGAAVGIIKPPAPPKSLGDFLTIYGTGTVDLKRMTATGGGTFRNQHQTGDESASRGHGIFYVTGVNSFVNAGGRLPSTMIDTIGESRRTLGGVLSLNVTIVSPPKAGLPDGTPPDHAPGVLEIHCFKSVQRADKGTEGIRFVLPNPQFTFNFVQSTGTTLFHALDE